MLDKKVKSPYELLRSRTIIAILDGDTQFGEIDNITISMPYLSGSKMVDISQLFGLSVTYGSQSRWVYLDDIMSYCITTTGLVIY